MAPRALKRFSTYLTNTIVALVTGSIVLISASLFIYFERQLESEFNKKLLAQNGETEIFLKNRLQTVAHRLEEVSLDSTVRFSMMLGNSEQLKKRLQQLAASTDGTVFVVSQNETDKGVLPAGTTVPPERLLNLIQRSVKGELSEINGHFHLFWCFTTPIVEGETQLGTVHVVYDMMADHSFLRIIRRNIEGEVAVAGPTGLILLLPDSSPTIPFQHTAIINARGPIYHIKPYWALTSLKIGGDLYFVSSRKDLFMEQKGLALLIGLYALLVLGFSLTISFFLGRQLGRPLGEMATKAIQIADGNKKIFFGNSNSKFLEFRLLQQAFDHMLMNLINADEKSRYQELLRNVEDAVYLIDRDGNIVDANEATYLRLGYTGKASSRLNLNDMLPVEDAKIFINQLDQPLHAHQPDKTIINAYHIRKDGTRLPVEISSKLINYRGRAVLLHVARDLTKRITGEKALRESEHRYRTVVENSHSGILILDTDYRILYGNNEVRNILGYSPGELQGRPFREILKGAFPAYLDKKTGPALPPVKLQPLYEQDMLRKDGTVRRCKIRATLIEGKEGTENLLLQILDITDALEAEKEAKTLEAQLFQAQKMQAIGRLAGGIAHDFNNILMAIQGRLSLIRLQDDTSPSCSEFIDEIEKSVKNAATLTRQLLGFARGGKYQTKTTDMNRLIEKSVHMFKRTHSGIKVETHYQTEIWPVEVDRTQLDQVLLNLFLNAVDAMPNGGVLTIKTKNQNLSVIEGFECGLPPGHYVTVSVTDTGFGMGTDVKDRVFEPFFTTKPMGLGTGLGLASVYGIIKNHKGGIHVESEKGMGSTFRIYLPTLAAGDCAEISHQAAATTKMKTILIVDDRPEFLEIGRAIIEQLGYHVETALGGGQAIDLLEYTGLNPDLVILDMVMPGMSGPEVFEKMKALRKDMRILMCSGYSLDHQAERLMARGCIGFIQKPFDIILLGQKLRDILN